MLFEVLQFICQFDFDQQKPFQAMLNGDNGGRHVTLIPYRRRAP
jgi:hypothetical protein